MKVELKKCKITGSVLNQILRADIEDFKSSKVLGFCVHKNTKWIVLYNFTTKEITKYFMFKDVISKTDHSDKPYWVRVDLGGNYSANNYMMESKKESDEIVELFKDVKREAKSKGQFFL